MDMSWTDSIVEYFNFTEDPAIGHLFLWAFLLSILFGIVAKSTSYCPLGGIADYLHSGRKGRLSMYFFSIGVAILGATLLAYTGIINLDNTNPPYRSSMLRWPGFLVGGLLFGIGMTLCRGCGMKNVMNLGGGDGKALIAIFGMGLAAYLLFKIEGPFNLLVNSWVGPNSYDMAKNLGVSHSDIGSLSAAYFGGDIAFWRLLAGVGISLFILGGLFLVKDFRGRIANIIGGLLLGLIIVAAYYLSGGTSVANNAFEAVEMMDVPQSGFNVDQGVQPTSYTFIRPMGDLLWVVTHPSAHFITFGLIMFLGVGVGALLTSIATLNFRFSWFQNWKQMVQFFVGGILVGIGGILGMGCTLGQGLAGMSTLALGSFIDLGALLFGAVIGIKLQSKFMDDHEVVN